MSSKTPLNEGEYKVGDKHPPLETRFGGPRANPRNTSGSWKKTETARYKLESLMRMSQQELLDVANNKEQPFFLRRMAKAMLKEDAWKVTESMINQTEGMPKERRETELSGEVKGININVKEYKEKDEKTEQN